MQIDQANNPARGQPLVEDMVYAGFWVRLIAALIDSLLLVMLITPLIAWFYGWPYAVSDRSEGGFKPIESFISWVVPCVVYVFFWHKWQATPGKMLFRAKVLDARTGQPASLLRLVVRYFGYLLSGFAFCLGFLWIAFDARKQGFHDKIAGTVVVRRKGTEPVRFG